MLPVGGLWAADRLLDLTHPFDATTLYWPTAKGFVLDKGFAGMTDKGYYYSANSFKAAEHGGTHIDAPVHFWKGGDTVDRIPLERLVAPGVLIDVSTRAANDRDYQVSRADLFAWEEAYGPLPAGSIALLRTGYGDFWPDRAKVFGSPETGAQAVPKLRFPGLHPKAAALLAERGIVAVGIDTPSIDRGRSDRFETHVALFARNIPAFENVANLSGLPAKGFTVIALPMKIGGGTGGPLRIVAMLPEKP